MDRVGSLGAARQALADRAWDAALEAFVAAEAAEPLSAGDLAGMADAAFWSGDMGVALDVTQRSHAAYLAEGRAIKAADAALVVTRLYAMQGDLAVASGWLERARRLLTDVPECAPHAHLRYLEAYVMLVSKDYPGAVATAREVGAMAARCGDRDLVVLARAMEGYVGMLTGDVVAGGRLLDEGLACASAGELGPFATAEVLCEMVVGSLHVADYEKAAEWLDVAERSDQITCFPGCCRVHRATVLRHRGKWADARREAEQARSEVAGFEVTHEGMALTELGELHRYKGDVALAERDFGQAYERGWSPQPGLALVLLQQGDIDGAAHMIERAVQQAHAEPATLVSLLPAQVEIALASGAGVAARGAGDQLVEASSILGTSAAKASQACVAGLLLRDQGDLRGAARELERGVQLWQQSRSPYEAALARLSLATVLEECSDVRSARFELATARSTFDRLGATPRAREAARRLGDVEPVHGQRTFMFTDIVNSTALLTTIGDDAWHRVRQWHDRTTSQTVTEHRGTVVKDTGDGFFIVFDEADCAVDCAVALQRALEAHRRTDGFSPSVRIGLHAGSAVVISDDYTGRDVVIAARISALAGPDQILVSADLAKRLGRHTKVFPAETKVLKGIPEPVDVAAVDWH
ncbi:MAG: hypothetical protein NVS3B12_33200 [Acidimicrobiales bacterium]